MVLRPEGLEAEAGSDLVDVLSGASDTGRGRRLLAWLLLLKRIVVSRAEGGRGVGSGGVGGLQTSDWRGRLDRPHTLRLDGLHFPAINFLLDKPSLLSVRHGLPSISRFLLEHLQVQQLVGKHLLVFLFAQLDED